MDGRQYEIHIKGHLSQDWEDWFGSLQICCGESGETVLSGKLADQAALLGILNKMNSMNLCILSVRETDRKEPGWTACSELANDSIQ